VYNRLSGFIVLTTSGNHDVQGQVKITISSANQDLFNGSFIFTRISNTELSVKINVTDVQDTVATGTITALIDNLEITIPLNEAVSDSIEPTITQNSVFGSNGAVHFYHAIYNPAWTEPKQIYQKSGEPIEYTEPVHGDLFIQIKRVGAFIAKLEPKIGDANPLDPTANVYLYLIN
jgi:hypothetical protein